MKFSIICISKLGRKITRHYWISFITFSVIAFIILENCNMDFIKNSEENTDQPNFLPIDKKLQTKRSKLPHLERKNNKNVDEEIKKVHIEDVEKKIKKELEILIHQAELPKKNVAFLKTHKCASSSIQNILFRFGIKSNLTMAVPRHGSKFNPWSKFQARFLPQGLYNDKKINIFAIHSKFDYKELKSLMPEDTVFISCVRNPATLFESVFSYFNLRRWTHSDINHYVANDTLDDLRKLSLYGYNQISFDWGMDPKEMHDVKKIRQFIKKMDAIFDLVFVNEKIEESLILFRHMMNWSLEDVIILKMNARLTRHKSEMKEITLKLLKKKQMADEMLYDHFTNELEERIEEFGRDRMTEEVSQLKQLTAEVQNLCALREFGAKPNDVDKRFKWFTSKVNGFVVGNSSEYCLKLAYNEIYMVKLIREKLQAESEMIL